MGGAWWEGQSQESSAECVTWQGFFLNTLAEENEGVRNHVLEVMEANLSAQASRERSQRDAGAPTELRPEQHAPQARQRPSFTPTGRGHPRRLS